MPRGVMNIHTAPCLGKVLFASFVAAVHEIKRVVEMDSELNKPTLWERMHNTAELTP
jgi:hypothetical protein